MITVFIMLLPISFAPFTASLSLAGAIDLPRTGQTTSFAPGDDGAIQAGVPWPTPRFKDNGNGTVTDNLTGLMWLKDANCIKTNYPAFDKDSTSGDGKVKWQHALDFVAGINAGTYSNCGAGYNDWRLPNVNELESLVNAGKANTAAWLNSQGFIGVQLDSYWSSTTSAVDTGSAWDVHMGPGGAGSGDYFGKGPDRYVWPVRAGGSFGDSVISVAPVWRTGQTTSYASGDDGAIQAGVSWPSLRFTDNGNGTVTDNLTGLMWLKDAGCLGSRTWQEALNTIADFYTNPGNYNCRSYTALYTDWRLPNRKELHSLTDFSQHSPALPSRHPFAKVHADLYWSSTTDVGQTVSAWNVNMRNAAKRSRLSAS